MLHGVVDDELVGAERRRCFRRHGCGVQHVGLAGVRVAERWQKNDAALVYQASDLIRSDAPGLPGETLVHALGNAPRSCRHQIGTDQDNALGTARAQGSKSGEVGFQSTTNESGGGNQGIPGLLVHRIAGIRSIGIVDDDEFDAERVKQRQVAHQIHEVWTADDLLVQQNDKGSPAMRADIRRRVPKPSCEVGGIHGRLRDQASTQ